MSMESDLFLNELRSDLRFQPNWRMHDNHATFDYAKHKLNDYSLDITSLLHHDRGLMFPTDTGKCPQAINLVMIRQNGQSSIKTSSAVSTQFMLKLCLLRSHVFKIETSMCVACLLDVRIPIVR